MKKTILRVLKRTKTWPGYREFADRVDCSIPLCSLLLNELEKESKVVRVYEKKQTRDEGRVEYFAGWAALGGKA